MINREGNPIYSKPWRQYAIYRLEHWGLLYINNKGKIATFLTKSFFSIITKVTYKGIEFLSQTLIFLSLYLCISMSETLDISNYELF